MGALLSIFGLGFMGAILSTTTTSGRGPSEGTHGAHIIHFPDKPTLLPVKKEGDGQAVEDASLSTLVQKWCPSLFKEFKPLWWLSNGHFQTLYCVLGNFSKEDRMSYLRRYIKVGDGGTLGLDFAPLDQDSLPDDTPIVIIQHGLTGGSYEPYVRAILHRATKPKSEGGLGYRAVVINFRGCAGVPITSPRLYSAGHTDDTRHALAFIAHKYPNARLHGVGFSLGSNVLTRYLGEEEDATRIHSACALACPWDLSANNNMLLNSFLGKHVYSKGMGGNLLNLLKKHYNELTRDPSHFVAVAAKATAQLKNPTLAEFDGSFTRIAGGPPPHFPFKNADEYYIWGSSHTIVNRITVPYLSINADDDPVVRHVPMDGRGNGKVVMQLTKGGGHLGWFVAGKGRVERWTTEPVLEWLKLMGERVVHKQQPSPKLYVDEEGWICEEGRDHIRCKEIEDKRHQVNGNGGETGILQGL